MSDLPKTRFPPQLRTIPNRPPDPYARARFVLHAAAFAAWLVHLWNILEWPVWAIIVSACEITAFALLRRDVEDGPAHGTEAGVRIGCGAVFGLIAGPWVAYYSGLSLQGIAGVIFAVVGAVVCASLALRFGDRFWHWV